MVYDASKMGCSEVGLKRREERIHELVEELIDELINDQVGVQG